MKKQFFDFCVFFREKKSGFKHTEHLEKTHTVSFYPAKINFWLKKEKSHPRQLKFFFSQELQITKVHWVAGFKQKN